MAIKSIRMKYFASSALPILLICVYTVFLILSLSPRMFGDDAAITFRYVDRIAEGHGFTYNDHERVIGASNPLYTLLLVIPKTFGISTEHSAYILYYIFFFITPLLAYLIVSTITNRFHGFLTAFALVTHGYLRSHMSNGLETGFSALLGVAVILAGFHHRQTLVGVLLGFAVWNKLDGGMLALAVAVSWLIIYRKFPWKIATVALLVVLPWFSFSFFYTGSIFPQSMTTKLVEHSAQFGDHYDHFWVFKLMAREYNFLLLLLAVLPLFFIRKYSESAQVVVLISVFWFLFHATAYTSLNFGDPYPWYLAVLFVPMILLAGIASHLPINSDQSAGRRWHLSLAAVLLFLFAIPCTWQLRHTIVAPLKAGNSVKPWQVHNLDRRMAGVFLNRFADKGEVVTAGWGWPAYQYRKGPFHDGSHLCSRKIPGEVVYQIRSGDPVLPLPGYEILADFDLASATHGGFSRFAVFGLPTSAIALKGIRYRRLQPVDLPAPEPYSDDFGMEHFKIGRPNTSVFAPSPTGFVYMFDDTGELGVPRWLYFRPEFSPSTSASETNGVVFKVLIDGEIVFRNHSKPLDNHDLVRLELPKNHSVTIAFITDSGAGRSTKDDRAWWLQLEFVFITGEIALDLSVVHDPELRRFWTKHNPITRLDESP